MCTFAYVVIAHYIRSAAAASVSAGVVAAAVRGLVYCSISYYSPCLLAVKIHQFSSFFFLFSSFVSVRFKSESLLSQLYVNAIRPRLSHLQQGVSLHNINQIQQRCNGWDSLFYKINDAEGKTCLVSISSYLAGLLFQTS